MTTYEQITVNPKKVPVCNETEFLTDLTAALIEVRSKKEFYVLLNTQLKKHFGYDSASIFLSEKGRNITVDYLLEAQRTDSFDPFHQQVSINFEDVAETADVTPYLAVSGWSGRVAHLFLSRTRIAHLVIGIAGEQDFDISAFQTLPAILNLLNNVLQQLINADLIAEKTNENDIIQSLNIDFASIREKSDLLRIIHFKLKKLFDFGHHWVAVLNEDQLTMTSFLQDSGSTAKDHHKYKAALSTKYTTNDRIFNKVLLSKEPQIFDLNQLATRPNMPEYMEIMYESGVKVVVMIGLQVGDRIIGVWAVCLLADQELNSNQLSLIKSISNQLSISVDNIIANMAIQKKEQESAALLGFSFALTTVRNRADLLKVVKMNVKKLITFQDLVIMVGNDGPTIKNHVFSSTVANTSDLNCQDQKAADKYFKRVLESAGIVFFNEEKFSNCCDREMICIGLSEQNYKICFFFLTSLPKEEYSDHDLELIKGVSYQLSSAVANILANEEIIQRENEKSRLLAFSNGITSVRDKILLAKVLKKQLHDLFGIQEYVIHALSEDKQTHMPILYDVDSDYFQAPEFTKLIGKANDIKDGIFDKILTSDDPVFFDINRELDQQDCPDYLQCANVIGLHQMIGVAIRLGHENIAVMNFIHDDYDKVLNEFHLFKSILSQIALTISNMLASDKLNQQLEEIKNYKQQLEEEKIYLTEEIETTLNYAEIVGESPVMQKTFRLVAQVAPSDSSVLLLGETGTGKELIARAIHNNSPRKNKLMVKVNCAALPVNLIESELFGHERGSFTGATERRLGKFELANNGTLFLDEIGEMPLDLQVKLLRALQEKEIERVGGNTTIKVNVRVIAATNRDLEKEMQAGTFRSDLYYRLNIFPIELPPLRDRKEDIPLLALYFIQRFAKKSGREMMTLSSRAMEEIVRYRWPGNIRELEHLIERSVLLANGNAIKQVHLPTHHQPLDPASTVSEFKVRTIDENEKDFIFQMLKYCNGRIGGSGGAAALLGVPTSTLNSKMKRLGIKREHFV